MVTSPEGATDDEIRRNLLQKHPEAASPPSPKIAGPIMGRVNAVGRGTSSGMFMNADDEIVAAINTFMPLDKITNKEITSVYEQMARGLPLIEAVKAAFGANVNQERVAQRYDEANYPLERTAGQLVGGVAGFKAPLGAIPGISKVADVAANIAGKAKEGVEAGVTAVGKIAPKLEETAEGVGTFLEGTGKNLARFAKTSVGQGASLGGVGGYMAGEGSTENRVKSAEIGAITGGAFGGVFGVLGASVPLIRSYWNQLQGKVPAGEAAARIVARLKRDGYDVSSEEGVNALQEVIASFGDKPVTIADVGKSVRALATQAMKRSTESAEPVKQLVARGATTGKRVIDDIKQFISDNPNVENTEAVIKAKTAEAVDPLYKEAYDRTLAYTDKLGSLLKRPSVRDALKDAKRIAEDADEDATKLGFIADSAGNVTGVQSPTMKTWDYISRALREAAEKNRNARGNLDATGQGLMGLRSEVLDELDTLEPAFGAARKIWRGRERALDALEYGQEILKKSQKLPETSPQNIAAKLGAMTPLEQELARMGAARKLTDDVAQTRTAGSSGAPGPDPALNILKNSFEEEQLGSFFPTREVVPYGTVPEGPTPSSIPVSGLKTEVGKERQLSQLSGAVPKQGESVTPEEGLGGVGDFFGPGFAPIMARIGRGITETGRTKALEELNNQLLPKLLEQDPAAIQSLIGELAAQGGIQARLAARLKAGVAAATRAVVPAAAGDIALRAPLDLEALSQRYPSPVGAPPPKDELLSQLATKYAPPRPQTGKTPAVVIESIGGVPLDEWLAQQRATPSG